MSSWPTVLVGGFWPLGMVIVAGLPSVTFTVGRSFGGVTGLPSALFDGVVAERTSTRNTTVSWPPTLTLGLPFSPKASFGGMATRRREPIFWLVSPFFSPGSRFASARLSPRFCFPKLVSSWLPSLPLTRTYFRLTISVPLTVAPSPSLSTRVWVSVTVSGVGLTSIFGASVSLPPETVVWSSAVAFDLLSPSPQALTARTVTRAATEAARIRRVSTGSLSVGVGKQRPP